MPTDSEAYQANLAASLAIQREDLEFRKADALQRIAQAQTNADRIARQDDERTAEAHRMADAQTAMAGGERRDQLLAIVRDLIGKRVTSTSVITGPTATSKASAVQLVADAKAIMAEMDKALPPG